MNDLDEREPTSTAEEPAEQRFWHWFAIAVLVFCWVAEATLCSLRGF